MNIYRQILNGGREFIDNNLTRFSSREDYNDFLARRRVTYNTNYARSLLMKIRNTIYRQMGLVTRVGVYPTHNQGMSINQYMCHVVLVELMFMGRVAVVTDRAPLPENRSLADMSPEPYFYIVPDENIEVCTDDFFSTDEFQYYVRDGYVYYNDIATELPTIPVTIISLPQSLLTDIADLQIALLNIESSDLAFLQHTNFPLYTEQVSGLQAPIEEKTATIGIRRGRAYGKGLERPGYISPTAETLRISIEKQEQIKTAMRDILNITQEGMADDELTAALESAENNMAKHWAMYMGTEPATITYPPHMDTRPFKERLEDAKALLDIRGRIPSRSFQVTVSKIAANLITQDYDSDEIDEAIVIDVDPEELRQDKEAGIVGSNTASTARMYPPGEAEMAKKEHLERLREIAISQSLGARGQRGVDASAQIEKDMSQDRGNQA